MPRTVPSGPASARTGIACWTRPPSQTRRTAASSTSGLDTCSCEGHAYREIVQALLIGKSPRRRLLGPPVLDRVDRLEREPAVVLRLGHVSTNSVSTPPT